MRTISIKGVEYAYDSARNVKNADVQALLAGCHGRPDSRPLCKCAGNGIPLQVKRHSGIYHLARMPDKGLEHASDCDFHGETEHSDSKASPDNLNLSFSVHIKQDSQSNGVISMAGLLNTIWTRANLHRWSKSNNPRSWKYVANQIYKGVKGLKLNGVPITQLLWVMPHMDEKQLPQVRDGCLNFVKSCNLNGHYAILVAPIGTSEYQNHSMCLRFRVIDKPPVFVDYKKFPIKTFSLKELGEYPFPVAIILVKAPSDKPYLQATDIAMLWMTPSYLPCVTKDRVKPLAEAMRDAEYLQVPLNQKIGEVLPEIALIKKSGNLIPLSSTEPIPQLPWIINDKK